MNSTVLIDVIRGSTEFYLPDSVLSEYKIKHGRKSYYYKNMFLENGAVLTIGYYRYFHKVFVKCSMPKILNGNNINLLNQKDFELTICKIDELLVSNGISMSFLDFKVSCLEITANYICPSEKDKQVYIDTLNKKYSSRRTQKVYSTSAVFKNKSSRTTVYDKSEEIKSRSPYEKLTNKDKRILRVEHKVPSRVLNKYANKCSVKDLLNINLKEVLKEENKRIDLEKKMLNKNNFYKILKQNIAHKSEKARNRIIIFYKELNEKGEGFVKNKYSNYIFNSYKRVMIDAGYNTVHTGANIKNIIDFTDIDRVPFFRYTKSEIKEFVSKFKKKSQGENRHNIIEKMVVKPFCLLCKFLYGASGRFVDTS